MCGRTTIFFIFLAGLLAAPAIPAQDAKDTAKPDNARFGDPTSIGRSVQGDLYGVIKKLSPDELVLDKTKFGVEKAIRLDSKTKYVRNKKSSSFDKLEIGDPVYVYVKKDKKTGALTAKKVTSGLIAAP